MPATEYQNIKILLIGCGSIGKRHIRVLLELGVTQIAACDPSSKQREEAQMIFSQIRLYEDYKQALLEWNPHAVFILTPTAMHVEMALVALYHNCHVFIEKPLSNTSQGVNKLRSMAEEKGLTVMVGFCFRYHEALVQAKKMVTDDNIGRLVNIRALMGEHFPTVQPNYLSMYYARYSGAFELIHDLDLAIWFAAQKVEEVYSVYGSYSDIGISAPDSIELLLKFKDRLAASVHLDFYQIPRRRQLELIGTNGVITVEFADWDNATLSYFTQENNRWEIQKFSTQRNDMFRDEDAEFLDAIQNRDEVSCTVEEAMKSLHVVENVYTP
ncbi:Gfo/Idh/MocA family oxidoreductase [Marispirochaeta sp.]|uniref:Gfo/Idh/MocA family protein n=1 Tax=Marispirochaeta sp. TaxID=2038653 RepID=UPI0029C882EA|nr:Gfo/Idh/MocA family oxidoreductase [Marispirochaeta sp.]